MSMTLNFFEHSFNRGRRLREAGRTNEAARLFDKLGLNATLPDEIAAEALTSLGQLQLEQGLVEAARSTMSEACRRDPFAAESHYLHAQACAEGDDADLDQAYSSLQSAVELEPESPTFRAELGKLQIALGMEEEGIGSLELAVELDPESPALLRDLVDALMDLGREAEAFQKARTALFAHPRIQGFRSLWNDLCFCQVADEINIAADQLRQATPVVRPHILQFESLDAPKATGRVGQRIIRQDGPSDLPPPRASIPFSRTDRRRA
jgi:tetratricopeptide (TPR) repeat protein